MSTGRHIGTLIVVILKARNLPNKRHIGKQDPYCQVTFNGEKRRTKAIKRGGQHPEWDEEIRFELYEDTEDIPHIPELSDGPPPPPPPKSTKGPPKVKGGKFMSVACYAEDPREPDLIGESKVDLTEVLTKGETDEWFTVMNKDKYCGEVYLELTFWLDEPPPTKKANPKPNGQYGGRGTFVPIGDSTSSSLSDLEHYSVSSRLSASSTEIRRETLPPSLRSSNSRLDIYVAPYESTRSHNSSVDGMVNEFAELQVQPGANRRQSLPAQTGSYMPRPASSLGLPDPYANGPPPPQHQPTYSDGGGSYQYDYTPGQSQLYHPDSAPLPDPYQPAYEQKPASSGFQPPHHARPRYSLPAASSGFVPLPTPAPSGFMPLNQQPTGFLPPPSATPAPYGGPVTPARVPSSSFASLPPVAPSGFMPSGQQPPPTSSFPPPVGPPSSLYYPPPQTSTPPGPYSRQGQHTPPNYPQQGSPLPPSSSFPQHTPPPSTSYPQNLPTSSFPHNHPPQSSYLPPPPPASAPPQQAQYPHSPSSPSIPQHAQSAPPEQQQQHYTNHITTSPVPDHIPPPPPLADSPSKRPSTGSRPLPQPQAQPQSSQSFSQQPGRRQSSLPVPPPNSQGYYNGNDMQNPPAFPSAMAYQSIPPPPPLPQQSNQPQSSFPQNGQQLALPGPPPPLPPSQSQYSQGPTPTPPKRRPSLPPPPVGYQSQQQSAYQSLPPPPPPPGLPSHLQYEPTSSFTPSNSSQAYYPGPPPRPPQYLPPSGPPPVNGGYTPPIPQGQEYDPYGR